MAEYQLHAVDEIPGRAHRGGRSLYGEILEAFGKSEHDKVEVTIEGRKPATIYQGLAKANKSSGLKIRVIQRSQRVYLSKQ